jgi:beta-glucanase (GH16 family)
VLGGLLYNRSLLVSELIGNWRTGPAGGPGSTGSTGQNHNKISTAVVPDMSAEIVVYELEWLADRVHWKVNGKLVRTWHPEGNSSIPQEKCSCTCIQARSGFCSKMKSGSSFDAQLLNFSYTPAAANEETIVMPPVKNDDDKSLSCLTTVTQNTVISTTAQAWRGSAARRRTMATRC